MAKVVVKIQIEVDMDSLHVKEWEDPSDYFEDEVDNVIREIIDITRNFPHSKYRSSNGVTKQGTQYSLAVRKSKLPQKIFFTPAG